LQWHDATAGCGLTAAGLYRLFTCFPLGSRSAARLYISKIRHRSTRTAVLNSVVFIYNIPPSGKSADKRVFLEKACKGTAFYLYTQLFLHFFVKRYVFMGVVRAG